MSEVHQLSCPFCGFNKPIKNNFRLKEMNIDPSEYEVISIRSVGPGPGRGHKGEKGEGLRTIGRRARAFAIAPRSLLRTNS